MKAEGQLLLTMLVMVIYIFVIFATGVWLLNLPSTVAFVFGLFTVVGGLLGAMRALYIIFREKK